MDNETVVPVAGNDLSSGDETTEPGRTKELTISQSCERCRIRKVKCDRAKPSCSWCLRHDRPCLYRERRRPGGGDMQKNIDLENRLGRLDALVHDIWQRVEDHITEHDATQRGLVFGSSYLDTAYTDLPSASPDTTLYPLNSDREPSTVGSGPSPGHLDAMRRPQELHSMPLASDPDLPPTDLLYALVDLFFKHINTWCPLLDRKATFGIYFGSTSVTEGDRVVLHAIVAATLKFAALTPPAKERFYRISSKAVELYALENSNLSALKALTLLSLNILGTSDGPRGWSQLALITSNVLHLDISVEKKGYLSGQGTPRSSSSRKVELAQPESWFEDEGRRRLCWVIYALDRYATVATGCKFMLAESDMKRSLPCRYDLWLAGVPVETTSSNWDDGEHSRSSPENLGSFSYHCEVLRILSRIDSFLKQPIDISSEDHVQGWQRRLISLETELSSWLHSLPGDYGKISLLCHSDPGARVVNWIMLHAAFVTSTIRLNSVAAYPIVQSALFVPSYRAMQTCLSAVDSLQRIAQDVLDINGLYLLGPHFAFSLWVSARLLVLHAATSGCEISPKFDFFINTLAQMGRYWPVASTYSAVLSRVKESSCSGGRTLTEMRQCAYEVAATSESTRISTLEPTWTRETSPDELDYVEIFDFFNYPRLQYTIQGQSFGGFQLDNHAFSMSFAAPSLENDWLDFETTRDEIFATSGDQGIE
ncbi:Fc.00g023690.m01.CDS01 [Cosmosporella sp. VM-42]